MRDIILADTVYIAFTTRAFATGIPTALAGTPVVSAYEDAGLTQITAGITLGVDHDSVTGLNMLTIVATGANGYESGKDYQLVITTGTVGGVSVVGEVVGQFTIDNTAKAVWDRVLTGATHNIATSAGRRLRGIQEFQGYENGAIWIDTVNGTAGTTDYENGTVENPVDSIADANTIASSLGISRFEVAPGSTITLAAAQVSQIFDGHGWILALGGQNISNTLFHGADVTGTGTTATGECEISHSHIGNVTVGECHFDDCGISGTVTAGAAGDYTFSHCYSEVAGNGSWTFDFVGSGGNIGLSLRDHSGGVTINNKDGGTDTDTMTIEGDGQLIVAASSSGAISRRGNFKITNTGGATLTNDDNTANIALTVEDTNELQTDWANGGRLDTILDGASTHSAADVWTAAGRTLTDGIQKNATFSNFEFLMVDSTDHVTPKTGLTVTGQRSIDGAAFASVSGSIAEVSNGIYQFDAVAADTNGDVITWRFSSAGADDRFVTITTQ